MFKEHLKGVFSAKLFFAFCLLLFYPFLIFGQSCKDDRSQFYSLSNQLGNLKEFIDFGYCKQIKENQNSQEITIEIKKKESITEKISVHFNVIFISLEGRPASVEADIVFEKQETVKRGFGANADAHLQFTADKSFCVQCRVIDISDVILEDVEINYLSGPKQDEVVTRLLPGFDATAKTNSKKPISSENINPTANPEGQKEIQSVPSAVSSNPLPSGSKPTDKNSISDKSLGVDKSSGVALDVSGQQENSGGGTTNEKQTVKDQAINSVSQEKNKSTETTQQIKDAAESKMIDGEPKNTEKSSVQKITETTSTGKESISVNASKANSINSSSENNPQTKPQIAQIPQTTAVPFPKEEYEKKIKQKVDQLQEYLQRLTDKSSSISMTNRTIEQCLKLFINEGKNAIVGVSSVNSPTLRKLKIRDYLVNLSRLPYQKVEITWTEIFLVDNFKLGPDSNYYATVSFQQTFRGFNDNNIAYGDLTHKNIDIIIKPYSMIELGVSKDYWEILLGDIRVTQTEKAK
jgi:hypothetical protein